MSRTVVSWIGAGMLLLAGGAGLAQQPVDTSSKAPPGAADRGAEKPLAGADRKFVMEAAQGGMMEVELGQLATRLAADEEVKQFGQRMVTDHQKANSELMDLASRRGVAVSKELEGKHKAMMDKLSQLSGAAFDRQYMREMVKDHRDDVAAFEREARQGKDEELRNWSQKTLPTLREHLTMAARVDARLKGVSNR